MTLEARFFGLTPTSMSQVESPTLKISQIIVTNSINNLTPNMFIKFAM
jgi:hypothetical protein